MKNASMNLVLSRDEVRLLRETIDGRYIATPENAATIRRVYDTLTNEWLELPPSPFEATA